MADDDEYGEEDFEYDAEGFDEEAPSPSKRAHNAPSPIKRGIDISGAGSSGSENADQAGQSRNTNTVDYSDQNASAAAVLRTRNDNERPKKPVLTPAAGLSALVAALREDKVRHAQTLAQPVAMHESVQCDPIQSAGVGVQVPDDLGRQRVGGGEGEAGDVSGQEARVAAFLRRVSPPILLACRENEWWSNPPPASPPSSSCRAASIHLTGRPTRMDSVPELVLWGRPPLLVSQASSPSLGTLLALAFGPVRSVALQSEEGVALDTLIRTACVIAVASIGSAGGSPALLYHHFAFAAEECLTSLCVQVDEHGLPSLLLAGGQSGGMYAWQLTEPPSVHPHCVGSAECGRLPLYWPAGLRFPSAYTAHTLLVGEGQREAGDARGQGQGGGARTVQCEDGPIVCIDVSQPREMAAAGGPQWRVGAGLRTLLGRGREAGFASVAPPLSPSTPVHLHAVHSSGRVSSWTRVGPPYRLLLGGSQPGPLTCSPYVPTLGERVVPVAGPEVSVARSDGAGRARFAVGSGARAASGLEREAATREALRRPTVLACAPFPHGSVTLLGCANGLILAHGAGQPHVPRAYLSPSAACAAGEAGHNQAIAGSPCTCLAFCPSTAPWGGHGKGYVFAAGWQDGTVAVYTVGLATPLEWWHGQGRAIRDVQWLTARPRVLHAIDAAGGVSAWDFATSPSPRPILLHAQPALEPGGGEAVAACCGRGDAAGVIGPAWDSLTASLHADGRLHLLTLPAWLAGRSRDGAEQVEAMAGSI